MKTSIIVPTKNRAKDLEKMLASVLTQSVCPDEIVIIDQSETDESERLAHTVMKGGNGIHFNFVRDRAVRGAAQARNRAVQLSKGEIIFFLDDDVVLERDYIKNTIAEYVRSPQLQGVGGVVTNMKWLGFNKLDTFDRTFKKGIFKDVRREMYVNHEGKTDCMPSNKLSGCCASYKRAVLGTMPFDEVLDDICDGYAFGEDVELSMRLSKDHQLVMSPHARLAHYSGTIKTVRKDKDRLLYLEVASWTYIFMKNYRSSVMAWLCFLWLGTGWFLRALKGLLRLDGGQLKALFGGYAGGLKLLNGKK